MITFKVEREANLDQLPLDFLTYAVTLAYTIQVQVELDNLRFAEMVHELINLILAQLKKQVHLDLIVICGTNFTKSSFKDFSAKIV